MLKGKASIRFNSGAYTQYVSILKRIAPQPLSVRCIFEIGFKTRRQRREHCLNPHAFFGKDRQDLRAKNRGSLR